MKRSWKLFSFELPRYMRTPLLISLLLGSIMIVVYISALFRLQPVVPIFYSQALPSQQLASRELLIIFPIISFVISMLHLLFVQLFKFPDEILIKIFLWATVCVQILLGIAMMRILILVT